MAQDEDGGSRLEVCVRTHCSQSDGRFTSVHYSVSFFASPTRKPKQRRCCETVCRAADFVLCAGLVVGRVRSKRVINPRERVAVEFSWVGRSHGNCVAAALKAGQVQAVGGARVQFLF